MNPTTPYFDALREDPEWVELARQAQILQQAPWSFSGKWVSKAIEAIKEGRVHLGTPPSVVAEIIGQEGIYTVTGNTCDCPARRTRKDCYHPTAAELYRLYHGKLRLTPDVASPGTGDDEDADDGYIPEPDEGSPLLYSVEEDTPLPGDEAEGLPTVTFPQTMALHLTAPELRIRHAGAVMQEAPFSMNLTVETPKGFTPQFTVRAQTEEEFKHRIIALLKMCEEKQYVPRRSRQEVAASPPSAATTAMTPALPPTTGPRPEGWCPIHDVQMKQNLSKDGKNRTWWSHKVDEGWCKGKAT